MGTPNYLGFLQAAPKESPFMRALKTGMETYGDVQKLMQQTYLTRALPKDIEQQQTLNQQKVDKGALEAKYYPKQLEQEQTLREQEVNKGALLLKALPAEIRNKLTGEQLSNMHQAMQNKITGMSINDAQQQLLDAEMTKLHDVHMNHPELEDTQIKASKKILSSYGINASSIPDKPDTSFWGMAALSAQRSPQAQALQKYQQELTKTALEGKLKIDAETAKQGNTLQKTVDQKIGEATGEWLEKTLPDQVEAANRIDDNMNDIVSKVHQHSFLFGPVGQAIGSSIWATPVIFAKAQAMNTIIEQLKETPGASRGTKALLGALESSKINVGDTAQAILEKAQKIKAVSALIREEQRFANTMREYGVNDKAQIEESWDKFLEAKTYRSERGVYNPEGAKQWSDYFAKHPGDLPRGLVQSMQEQNQYKQSITPQEPKQETNAGPQLSYVPPSNNVTQTGIVNAFDSYTSSGNEYLSTALTGE